MRFMPVACLAAAAALLWSAAAAGLWVPVAANADRFVLAAATTLTVAAWVWWLALRLHDDDHRLLLRSVAELTRPRDLRVTRPLHRVR
jgi:hypothetical protein